MSSKIASTNWFDAGAAPGTADAASVAPPATSAFVAPAVSAPSTPPSLAEPPRRRTRRKTPTAPTDSTAAARGDDRVKARSLKKRKPHTRHDMSNSIAPPQASGRTSPSHPHQPIADSPSPSDRAAETPHQRAPRWRRIVSLVAFAVVVGAWFVTLRPTWLGGSASVLTVRGVSMEPTYHYGDVIITHRRAEYHPGDIVAFRVPAGEVGAGTIVIHRITGGDATAGFTTQGDNNPDPDDWRPLPADILGAARWRIPAVGRLTSVLRSLPGIAVGTGLLAALLVMFGTEAADRPRRDRSARRRRGGREKPPVDEGALPETSPRLSAQAASVTPPRESPPGAGPLDDITALTLPTPTAGDWPRETSPHDNAFADIISLTLPAPSVVAPPGGTPPHDGPLDDIISPPLPAESAAAEPPGETPPPDDPLDDIISPPLPAESAAVEFCPPTLRQPAPDEHDVVGEYLGDDLAHLTAILRERVNPPAVFDDDVEGVATRPV